MINYSEIFREANESDFNFSFYGIANWLANHLPILILYLIIGFILMLLWYLKEMRGKDYDEEFFDGERTIGSIIFLFLWLPLLILCLLFIAVGFMNEKKYITRLLYKIANVGISKDNQLHMERTERLNTDEKDVCGTD